MSDDFQGLANIELETADMEVPFQFDFPEAGSALASDGAIPRGDAVSSVLVTALSDTGTDVTAELITGAVVVSGNAVTLSLSYPSQSGPGRYHLVFEVTTKNGAVFEFDFDRVLAEGPAGFLNLLDLARELGITNVSVEVAARLEALIEAIEDLWDQMTGRVWAVTTHTEIHGNLDGFTYNIFLKNYPLSSIDSIKIDNDRAWGADVSELESSAYHPDFSNGIISFVSLPAKGLANIRVVYQAGYAVGSLPASIKQIMIRQACHWFKQAKDSAWNMSALTQAGGGGIKFGLGTLKDNLLPDFQAAALRHQRPGL